MKLLLLLSLAAGALSQRPMNTSICDYYTTALLKENNATNQYTLLTLLVNTVAIGNYTQPNVGIAVPGILAKGQFNGKDVNLAPYFDGTLASSNRGGDTGVSVNFLDDGGAAPLMKNMPAAGTNSNQYRLLTHLYAFFGALLGCTHYGMDQFPAYEGAPSMGAVHRFMNLDENEVGYFITQVGLAASSFGAAKDDVMAVGTALAKLFNVRCAPEMTAIPAQGPQLQSICVAESCPLAEHPTCAAYPPSPEPQTAASSSGGMMPSSSMMSGSPTSTPSMNPSSTPTPTPSASPGGAGTVSAMGAVFALAVGLVGFANVA